MKGAFLKGALKIAFLKGAIFNGAVLKEAFLKSKGVVNEKNKIESDEVNDNFNVGESVELDLEPDQLNLFNEKD